MKGVGFRVYGFGIMALAVLCLAWGVFDPGQPAPKAFFGRTFFAYAAAALMLVASTAIEWRRSAPWGAATLTVYYTVIVVLMMYGRLLPTHYSEFGFYSGAAEQLAIAAGGLIIYAMSAKLDAVRAARLARAGQAVFGVCAVLFGGAHFFYMNLTAPLVPRWLPPSQVFWGYATGIAQVAAGLALLTGLQARPAAVLLAIMYACFTLLVHGPMLLSTPANHYVLTENALNLTLIGVAWVVADSLAHLAAKRAQR